MSYEQTLAHLEEHNQAHLLSFYPDLSPSEQESLLTQIKSIDIPRVNRIFRDATKAEQDAKKDESEEVLEPLPSSDTASTSDPSSGSVKKWHATGMQAIKEGKVGIILMAGGQGTRLGSAAPKGCYDIGLPSGKSLFRMQGERIKKLDELAHGNQSGGKGGLVWYVMTSGPTRKETERYFRESGFFGLSEENVVFFDQGVLPALTNDGKIFLQDRSAVAVAPDGNGGLYAALRQPLSNLPDNMSVLQHMQSRGIQHVHAYCVDNCLVRVADPVFLGYSIEKGAETGAKVVKKRHAKESVGVLAMRNGKYGVVEYSEMGEKEAGMKSKENPEELAFRAANIANHYFTLEFLQKMESLEKEMTFHIARKKIAHVDTSSGESIKPSEPNGMKLELFVFDVFPFTSRLAVLEVPRSEEFSPLKNAPGSASDCPETSRQDILAQHVEWLIKAGAKVKEGVEVEIAPSVSYAGEGLEEFKGKKIGKSMIIDHVDVAHGL